MNKVDTHELSEPWAQRAWRVDYSIFSGFRTAKSRRNARIRMRKIRREAALERALEAERRKVNRLRTVAHNAVAHVGAANYPEHEEQAHDWIDAV